MAATQQQFNDSALEYLAGHAKNFKASMTGGDVTPVQPWFGEGGRLQALNNSGNATTNNQPQPGQVDGNGVVSLTGTPKIPASHAAQPLPQPQPAAQSPAEQQLSSAQPKSATPIPVGKYGWKGTSESVNGNPTLVLGTPGTDNSGVGSWRPGSARPANNAPVSTVSPNVSVQPQTTAIAQLAGQPAKSPLEISMENSDRMKTPANQGAQTGPRYLSRAEGDALGIGWKGRLAKYKEDIDTYNKATGNAAAMDLEAMREAGAGQRAILGAQVQNDANAIAMQRLIGENAMNEARIATEGVNQQKGQLDINQAQNLTRLQQQYLGEKDPAKQRLLSQQLLTMQGKDPKEWQITTREETDPANPMIPKKVSYAVNLQDPTRVVEIGGQGNRGPLPLPNEASQRKPGQVYMAPSGHLLQWDGKGLKPAQ